MNSKEITIDIGAITQFIDEVWTNYKSVFGMPDKGIGSDYSAYRIWSDKSISFYWYDYKCMEEESSDAIPFTTLPEPMRQEKQEREKRERERQEREKDKELKDKRKRYERLKKELGE